MEIQPKTDAELIEEFSRGSAEALVDLLYRYEDVIMGTAERTMTQIGLHADPEDFFNDVFLLFYKSNSLATFDRNRPFKPWLKIIVHRLVLQDGKVGASNFLILDPEKIETLGFQSELESPSRIARKTELVEAFKNIRAQLDPAERELLDVYHDQTVAETAEQLGVTEGAIWARRGRLRIKVSKLIGDGQYITTVLGFTDGR